MQNPPRLTSDKQCRLSEKWRAHELETIENFSTATLLSALACQASAAIAAASSQCEFSEQAPDAHLVVTGDTLWDLAALFLKDPWCWPQVWEQNHAQIRDPHWIYPGQTIYFQRALGQLRLSNEKNSSESNSSGSSNGSQGNKHLSPRIRSEQLASAPLAMLPSSLQTIIAQAPLLLDDALPTKLRIVAIADEHQMAGRNDTVFVSGELGPHKVFNVVRTAQPVKDPDSQRVIGYSAVRNGALTLSQAAVGIDEPHRFTVTASSAEIRPGDMLIASSASSASLATSSLIGVPHPAAGAIDGRIATVLRGNRWANLYDVVAINRGQQHGLDAGSVLSVMKHVRIGAHDSAKNPVELATLPVQQIGALLVFSVSRQASLALVMRASDGIAVGDMVRSASRGQQ